jgi:para-aminobenzoate synthetase/4-amino-4-deoxychorismate lyase
VDRERHAVEYGVGGGVVWDSTSDDEYEECLLKARVVTRTRPEFDLLETILWRRDSGFILLSRHLARLKDSADYFGFVFREDFVRARLEDAVAASHTAARVRLRLNRQGEASCEAGDMTVATEPWSLLPPIVDAQVAMDNPEPPLRLALARASVDSSDVFLFHKTTRRQVYEQALQEARVRVPGCADVLLFNQRGEVTESTIANVVVEMDGHLLTPPLSCGLLAGTLRAELLERGVVQEACMTVEDLHTRITRLWLVNSVRGWRAAAL